LALCQRYYEQILNFVNPCANGGLSNSYGTSQRFAVTKRATPTLTFYSEGNFGGTSGSFTFFPGSTALVPDTEWSDTGGFEYRYTGNSSYTLSSGSVKISSEL
jgi:hypothetical protein